MSLVWTKDATYRLASYQSESDLEAAINQVKLELFGEHRIYLDVKKKIGAKAGLRNVPDGYLGPYSDFGRDSKWTSSRTACPQTCETVGSRRDELRTFCD